MNRREKRAAKSLGIDVGETDVRYGGRTIQVTVLVNTDEPEDVVLMRVRNAARGPRVAMCLASVGVLEPDAAKDFWDRAVPIAKSEAKKGGVS